MCTRYMERYLPEYDPCSVAHVRLQPRLTQNTRAYSRYRQIYSSSLCHEPSTYALLQPQSNARER